MFFKISFRDILATPLTTPMTFNVPQTPLQPAAAFFTAAFAGTRLKNSCMHACM
jgi:hypothetical protein